MGFFSSSSAKNSYLGIDIGFGGIKMVELANEKSRARLITYAYVNLPSESLNNALLSDVPGTADLIKRMAEKARVTTKRVVSVLPISSVFSSVLSIPTVDEKELKDAVMAQAKKLIPLPIEDVSLQTKVVEKTEKAEGVKPSTRVLVTAAPKTLVATYMDIFKQAGLEFTALETEAFAEVRSLIGKDRSTIMLVDMGSLRTNVIVVEFGLPILTRSIATGGTAMTQTIAKTLGIPSEQAESMKRDIKALQSFTPSGDLFPILAVLLKPILDEIRYSLSQYQQTASDPARRIEKIVLTGGSSLLPRLAEYLTKETNINTYLGNPWARVIYPPDLRPVLDELGPRMAVAVGSAMREIETASS